MIFPFELIVSVAGIYICGVVSGVSALALLTFIYVGRGNSIVITKTDEEM
tara:strand:+ start:1683 stop:1832 length:150 start_codon:yes stop_codon:yes gene_type:complete